MKTQIRESAAATAAGFPRCAELGHGLPAVSRLGLATRGNTRPSAEDVAYAVERGVNYLNSCGYDDAIARAVRERLVDRRQVVLAAQLGGRAACESSSSGTLA